MLEDLRREVRGDNVRDQCGAKTRATWPPPVARSSRRSCGCGWASSIMRWRSEPVAWPTLLHVGIADGAVLLARRDPWRRGSWWLPLPTMRFLVSGSRTRRMVRKNQRQSGTRYRFLADARNDKGRDTRSAVLRTISVQGGDEVVGERVAVSRSSGSRVPSITMSRR